jgi:hypothetical protein
MRNKTYAFRIALGLCAAAVGVVACSGGGRSGNKNNPGDGKTPLNPGGCQGLECYQFDCSNMAGRTTLTGRVFAPNGLDPVYDALVYVPKTLPEFPGKVQCEACNEPIGGTPIVTTNTAVDGSFTLVDVPATMQVPIAVQKGRFRRVFNVDVAACQTAALPKDLTRLPKNQSEGDLPKMAVGVGAYDQIECVLRSIGIDESEFTPPSGGGAVHLYDNYDGSGAGSSSLANLLVSSDKMSNYNLIFVNCTDTRANSMPTGWKQNMYDYVNAGGRLYVTDWAYDYMEQVPQFAPYVFFEGAGTEDAPQPADTAYFAWTGDDLTAHLADPTLAEWMKTAGASSDGNLNIIGSWALANHVSANPMYQTHLWVDGNAAGKDRPMTATYDYNSCGKVLWSSYHTQEWGGGRDGNGASSFPSYCKSTASTMIPQEKVLEFLIFQISDCVPPVM